MHGLINWQSHFDAAFGNSLTPTRQFFAPGRVNFIGEHIDYVGGPVMPLAISKGITAWGRSNFQQKIRIKSLQADGVLEIDLAEPNLSHRKADWMNYPLGVFAQLHRAGFLPDGVDVLLYSDLPSGAGLSSSAALELIIAFALQYGRSDAPFPSPSQMALLCQKVEHEFIGVQCGIMDQFAVANGKKDNAMLLDCHTLDCEYIPFHIGKYKLLVINSNKCRQLSESKYNERKAECDTAFEILQRHFPLQNLCEAQVSHLPLIDDAILRMRVRHVITETQRVKACAQAMQAGNLQQIGNLLNASHVSLSNDYEATGFELDTLATLASSQPDCLGARMTGAGFGGCVIALVAAEELGNFEETVGEAYRKATGLTPDFFEVEVTDGVRFVG